VTREEDEMARAADTVGEVMTRDVAVALAGDPMEVVIRGMADRDIGAIVVVEGERPIGIVTERDVLRHILDAQDLRTRPVTDVMSAPAVTIGAGAEIVAAFELMNAEGIRRLPVVEGERLVGIVTDRDLLGWVGAVVRE
jgi:CBS domain-containing protein